MVDPVESVRGEVLRKIVQSGAFPIDSVQRENGNPPSVMPYCRLTMAQAGEWQYSSQRLSEKTVIAEIDIYTSSVGNTQLAGQLASTIEAEFGVYDRDPEKRIIPLPGWSGVTAEIVKIGRSSTSIESDRAIYSLPLLLYVTITMQAGAKYSEL